VRYKVRYGLRKQVLVETDGAPGGPKISDGPATLILLEDTVAPHEKVQTLLGTELTIINVGLVGFAEDLLAEGANVVQVDWSPPAGGNVRLADLLSKLGG
jgi:FdrA protein